MTLHNRLTRLEKTMPKQSRIPNLTIADIAKVTSPEETEFMQRWMREHVTDQDTRQIASGTMSDEHLEELGAQLYNIMPDSLRAFVDRVMEGMQ